MIVNLTFFKTTGKYNVVQNIDVEDGLELWEIHNRVESLFDYNELCVRRPCYILVEAPEHKDNHPKLIVRA